MSGSLSPRANRKHAVYVSAITGTSHLQNTNTMEIKLKHGLVALVDPEDDDLVRHYKWSATYHRHTHYAITTFKDEGPDERMRCIYMHRLVARVIPGEKVDHRNHNGLDNRRGNLRKANGAQNYANARIDSERTRSGYRGVWPAHTGTTWLAMIKHEQLRLCLGGFPTKEEAAAAYDVAAIHLWGEFATPNNPPISLSPDQIDNVLGRIPVISHDALRLLHKTNPHI